jgi:hypothetical protein
VHTVLVGGRGIGAPLLGYLVIQIATNLHGFALSAVLFGLAALQMARLGRAAPAPPGPAAPSSAQVATTEAVVQVVKQPFRNGETMSSSKGS